MFNVNQNNIIALSILSNKIWDLLGIILQGIINAILWENRTYTSIADNTSEFFRILRKISKTYYVCSETRIQYETEFLMPTGFIIGPSYIAFIKTNMNETSVNRSSTKIIIQIYGWFSIKSLITEDIVSDSKGKYKFIETGYSQDIYVYTEDFPEHCFHPNTSIASKYIYESIMKQHNHSGVYLLFGIPNTGKTTTAKQLYNYFDGTSVICPDLLHPQSGIYDLYKSFKYFYSKVKPEKNRFLIFVMDEVDELIHNIFVINKPDKYDIKSPTKQSWNLFLEKVSSNKNVVLILTTNKTKDYFDTLDSSLFREHRLTGAFQFTENDVIPQEFKKKITYTEDFSNTVKEEPTIIEKQNITEKNPSYLKKIFDIIRRHNKRL